MKLLKQVIAIALLNALIVLGTTVYGSSKTKISSSMPANIVTPTVTIKPKITQAPIVITAAPTQIVDNRCLIMIDGVKYNVTVFRQMHSGGDIFSCGTDMSGVFWSRHGQSMLNRLQQYRVN